MAVKQWSDLTRGERAAVLVLGSVQVSLAAAAWTDLAVRPPEQVRGKKLSWAAIIAVNFVGPVLYYTRGRLPAS